MKDDKPMGKFEKFFFKNIWLILFSIVYLIIANINGLLTEGTISLIIIIAVFRILIRFNKIGEEIKK